MTDRIRSAPDVPYRPAGVGMYLVFLCARCNQRKEATGRKLQRVQGTRQFVCKGCAL